MGELELADDFNPLGFKVLFTKKGGKVIAAYGSEFRGFKSFHIRILYEDDDGKWRPTKEGVSVPIGDAAALIAAIAAMKA